ncbi:MAG: hypothetical protein E7311_07300 [Clostridiales bacterium]|nr:hypothetical protein [Clostridiales bacterium]
MQAITYKKRAEVIKAEKDPITTMQDREIINMIFWSLVKCNQIVLYSSYYEKLEKLFAWKSWSNNDGKFSEISSTVVLSEFYYKEKLEITLEQTPNKAFYILRKISSQGLNFECTEFDEEKEHIMLSD